MAPWWLYGSDLALARELQHEKIRRSSRGSNRLLAEISILSYLGDYESCERWLNEVEGWRDVIGRQSTYRIRRYRREPNPWSALLADEREDQLFHTINYRLANKLPVVVDLVGGIGDQLENAALLLAVQSQLPQAPSLAVRTKGEHAKIVEDLLRQCDSLRLHQQRPGDTEHPWSVTAPWFRYWLGRISVPETITKPLLHDTLEQVGPRSILVCWRTKPDRLNPLSSFSRSLPFHQVQALLERWRPQAQKQGLRLIDISDYSAEEAAQLEHHASWVELAREQIRNLDDTRRLMRRAEHIATVDTSLGHLAVLCGRRVQLLLPQWPDERWYDLLGQGVYHQGVQAHRQRYFHRWNEPLESLSRSLQLVD